MLLASLRVSHAWGMGGCATRGVPVPGCAILAGPVVDKGRDIVNTELITLVVGILTLAGGQIAAVLVLVGRMDRQTDQMNQRFDDVNESVNQRFDGVNDRVNRRFDAMSREFADLRERMARLEGALEGFIAGRRDRDVA